MNTLKDLITSQIATSGPITIADYMAQCLGHRDHGYYMKRTAIGAQGDFTTAPEISQMFGELTGLALTQAWMDQDAPRDAILVELGPGRGTLMADMLRVMKQAGFTPAVHLVETSPKLRALQADLVPDATWHATVNTLPDAPTFLIANEFFDALPIRQFQRAGNAWREHVIGLQNGTLSRFLTEPVPLAELAHRLEDTQDGDVVETCAPAAAIGAQIGAQIASCGGAGLIIDYGDWVSQGDTFQAIRNHASTDPLLDPGMSDLTAHVDFAALAKAAHPACHSALATQGVFLERLGITARAQALAANLQGAQKDAHIAAHLRLTHPSEMGSVFKVLGLTPPCAPMLAGLNFGMTA